MFSDPVVGENFFGRQTVIDLLIKRTKALKSGYRQNVAIIGHRQLGKTSILRQYLHLHKDPEILVIYVEIKLQALDFFVDQFIRALLYEFLCGLEKTGHSFAPTDVPRSRDCGLEKTGHSFAPTDVPRAETRGLEMTAHSSAPTDVPRSRGCGLEMTGHSAAPTDVPRLRDRGLEDVKATDSLASLSEKAAALLPRTVSKINDIAHLLKHRHAEEAYSKLFELTAVIREETGKKCVVILDEFHRLGEFGVRNAFSDFGRRIMVQKDTMYVLASSSFSASRKILAEKLSLLFGHFERIYLEPFDFETSFEFLEKKLAPARLPKALKHFIVAFTDGHPFFLETIASRLKEVSAAKEEAEVSALSVSETFLRLLYESQGILNQYFSKLIAPWTQANSKGSHLLILAELARGRNRLKDLSLAVNRRQSEISRQLNELMEHELLVKNGVFYRFHDKLFKFWLREVYEKKELSLLGTSGKIESFLGRMLEIISEFEELTDLDVTDRVASLFKLFRNDLIEIGEKKRQLPHFTEIIKTTSDSATPADGSVRGLIAKGHGRCWVCKIVAEKATEGEVLELVAGDASENTASKIRVLVALKGLEENARLLAKEKRVLTLGLSRLNLLMDLYGKAPVIHG